MKGANYDFISESLGNLSKIGLAQILPKMPTLVSFTQWKKFGI